jgi:hypothetical protein
MAKEKHDESQGQIAWETAEVKGGDLVVELAGDVSAAWSRRVGDIVERLDRSGAWGPVKVTRSKLRVRAVPRGRESDLRHLLEGAVQQVNADFAPQPERDGHDPASSEDAELTAAFRAFAEGEPEAADADG